MDIKKCNLNSNTQNSLRSRMEWVFQMLIKTVCSLASQWGPWRKERGRGELLWTLPSKVDNCKGSLGGHKTGHSSVGNFRWLLRNGMLTVDTDGIKTGFDTALPKVG